MESLLRIGVQKSGRLLEDSLELLKACDLDFERGRGSSLRVFAENFPAELLFLRDDDIPGYVVDGTIDCGIVGENIIAEAESPVLILEKLGFSKCRLSISVPKGSAFSDSRALDGLRIASAYPRLLTRYLKRNEIKASIHEMSGSVEIAPSIGLADAVCDLVSSGSTLLMNGLRELESIFTSEAVFVAAQTLQEPTAAILKSLLFRIRAVKRAKNCKYILLNIRTERVPEIADLIPGLRSPTVLPLSEPGWSSVHAVVEDQEFWKKIELLKSLGAEGILVCGVEKLM